MVALVLRFQIRNGRANNAYLLPQFLESEHLDCVYIVIFYYVKWGGG